MTLKRNVFVEAGVPFTPIQNFMRSASVLFCVFAGIVLSSCNGSTGQDVKAGPDEIFFNYKITGEEGNDSVTVILKFHEFSEYGPIVLFATAVQMDNQPMEIDSSSMTGPFFRVTRHTGDFTGNHTILVTAPGGKKYKERFTFRPFTILSGINDTMTREKIILQLNGLDPRDPVRVLMTDTSFTGEGINRVDTVMGNRIVITRNNLTALQNGPVNMELIKEYERPTENGTQAGGMISILYTVRREFYLKD